MKVLSKFDVAEIAKEEEYLSIWKRAEEMETTFKGVVRVKPIFFIPFYSGYTAWFVLFFFLFFFIFIFLSSSCVYK